MTKEHWLPVVGFKFYEVSDHGQVRSLERVVIRSNGSLQRIRSRILKPWVTDGYCMVSLHGTGQPSNMRVHTLVLEAFVGPAPDGMECCHENDIRNDNRLVNLRWGTRKSNVHDMLRNGHNAYAANTHCAAGHEYTAENTRWVTPTNRRCRKCHNRSSLKYMMRRGQLLLQVKQGG
jgi:hypothetical protein